MQILVVEDEVRLADTLCEILRQNKYTVDSANDGEDGLYYAETVKYDAVILDLMLPKMSGFEVLKRLREQKNDTPVLILTAKDSIPDKVKGLDLGADDYMTKPFSTDEFLARVRALTRRKGEVVINELSFGDLTLSLSNYQLCSGTKQIHLGAKEFEIMRVLMVNEGITVSKESLIAKVWGADSDIMDNSVETYMSFLRKKIVFLGSSVQIVSARKQGYYLTKGENAND